MDVLVYINRFLVALVLSIFFGNGATLAGVEEDYSRAKQLFDSGDYKTAMSAWGPLGEEGHSKSQVMLGYAYKNGMGVVKNNKTSFKWYAKAAAQGDSYAQFKVGSAYTNGEVVLGNNQTAVKWFTLAAKQGFGNAQYMLAVNYYNGRGVRKDYKRAYMWCTLALYNGTQLANNIKEQIAKRLRSYHPKNGWYDESASLSEAQKMSQICLASNYQTC
jgi:TPR repeat protein|tara:strand:- start:116 stop:766 length:651 start_codon:yes stop_codon:yes gene_type:complete